MGKLPSSHHIQFPTFLAFWRSRRTSSGDSRRGKAIDSLLARLVSGAAIRVGSRLAGRPSLGTLISEGPLKSSQQAGTKLWEDLELSEALAARMLTEG